MQDEEGKKEEMEVKDTPEVHHDPLGDVLPASLPSCTHGSGPARYSRQWCRARMSCCSRLTLQRLIFWGVFA